VGERRESGEQKYYLSNLPADAHLKTLASAIKARWICEQAHQQLKEELGLDHFEGRSWTGRRVPVLLRREGWQIGRNVGYRLYREKGLTLRTKQRIAPAAAWCGPGIGDLQTASSR
jgi:hypothetical protein